MNVIDAKMETVRQDGNGQDRGEHQTALLGHIFIVQLPPPLLLQRR